jgi:hypothetical protein
MSIRKKMTCFSSSKKKYDIYDYHSSLRLHFFGLTSVNVLKRGSEVESHNPYNCIIENLNSYYREEISYRRKPASHAAQPCTI